MWEHAHIYVLRALGLFCTLISVIWAFYLVGGLAEDDGGYVAIGVMVFGLLAFGLFWLAKVLS